MGRLTRTEPDPDLRERMEYAVMHVQGCDEQVAAILEAMGGTWDLDLEHEFLGSHFPCREPCPNPASGRHIRRWRWRSDPLDD